MNNNEIQKSILLILQQKRLSPEKAALIKAAVVERLGKLSDKNISDKLCDSFIEQSTQSRENESAIARKTHYHLKGIERAIHELIDTIKSQ